MKKRPLTDAEIEEIVTTLPIPRAILPKIRDHVASTARAMFLCSIVESFSLP